ncbi:MAG TPA: SDR family NAD(P)-dependent oxidoreductase [Pseudorhodoplanes sp.]|jgi:nucleoside-diphosphate-sugar epimerase|nr:SDR family NAD(P)-dependent oxidoreductase [Pseudorhodoplanes sp.]
MTSRRILVTGGSGFIGSALVRRLVREGHEVHVFDDNSRGRPRRLRDVENDVRFVRGDIRDAAAVEAAIGKVEEVHHLAYVNGTEFFYSAPELVLEVGVKGMINVLDGCRRRGIGTLILASSSEVYQTPPRTPTDENVPLVVPDLANPRYSYGGGKIISELMAVHYGRKFFDRVLIFRPHNVYGPDMGFEHVIPQFVLRLKAQAARHGGPVPFSIQGSGSETRSFCHVEDLVDGVLAMRALGEHLNVYHIGTTEEITIADLAFRVARAAGLDISLQPGPVRSGSTARRCPDISKLGKLGYKPRVTLAEGLPPTVRWYWEHADLAPQPS